MLSVFGSMPGTAGPTRAYATTTSCTTPPTDLVSWWPGDGALTDIVGGHTASSLGSTFGAGLVDQTFHLAGGGPYFTAPAAPDLATATQYSVEMWLRPAIDITPGYLDSTIFIANGPEDTLGLSNGDTRLELRGPLPRAFSEPRAWQTNTWYHIAATYQNPGGYRIYINGALAGSTSEIHSIFAGATTFSFGWVFISYGVPASFAGDLDEISIYRRALTDAEIAAIYAAGADGKCKTPADTTPPTIAITAPTATSYLLNQTVTADYACTDTGSGLASCIGPVPNGSPIATTPVGAHAFTVNAADNAGNTATTSVNYTIDYKICLLYDPTKVHKQGSTIPIKIQLCDVANTNNSASSITVTAHSITQTSTSVSGPVEDSGNANPDNNFRYDPALDTSGGYIYNLSTAPLTTGAYTLNFTVGASPTTYAVPFQVK